MLTNIKLHLNSLSIPGESLAARYNWCQGPVPGRGPAVEKHWTRPFLFITPCTTRLAVLTLCWWRVKPSETFTTSEWTFRRSVLLSSSGSSKPTGLTVDAEYGCIALLWNYGNYNINKSKQRNVLQDFNLRRETPKIWCSWDRASLW